jgi:hypothetical protein
VLGWYVHKPHIGALVWQVKDDSAAWRDDVGDFGIPVDPVWEVDFGDVGRRSVCCDDGRSESVDEY